MSMIKDPADFFHKADDKEILVTMRFEDWMELYREWEAGNGQSK